MRKKGVDFVSLNEATEQNLALLINGLAENLKVINRAILDPDHYDLSHYEEIKNIYDMVKRKGNLSVPEIHAILDELSRLRK
jgi:uncharacterized protein YfkK (UPF0435 family)